MKITGSLQPVAILPCFLARIVNNRENPKEFYKFVTIAHYFPSFSPVLFPDLYDLCSSLFIPQVLCGSRIMTGESRSFFAAPICTRPRAQFIPPLFLQNLFCKKALQSSINSWFFSLPAKSRESRRAYLDGFLSSNCYFNFKMRYFYPTPNGNSDFGRILFDSGF
ncbi:MULTISPECIES: hypothetical protein [Anaerotruncus]|uniref:hypothetical protein n=1 Tax=Anaerotruncus TaxID=244127 RepID=UPI0011C21DF3|nr:MULTISPECIES: hypothetical protein [Anaerotruncus]